MKAPVLVIRLGKMGDSIMTFESLGILRQRFAGHPLHVLTENANAGTFALCAAVDRVITLPALHYRTPRLPEKLAIMQTLMRLARTGYHHVFDWQDLTLKTELIARFIAPAHCTPFPGKWWWTRRKRALPGFMRAPSPMPMREGFNILARQGESVAGEKWPLRIPPEDRTWAEHFWHERGLAGKFVVFCHRGANEPHKV